MEFISITGAMGLNLLGSLVIGVTCGAIIGGIYNGIRWIVLKVKKQQQ